MTTAVDAHRRPGSRTRPYRFTPLSPWHFVYLVAVLLIFGTLFSIVLFAPLATR
jgi:hypothetical protein